VGGRAEQPSPAHYDRIDARFAGLGLLAFACPMRTDEVLGANIIHTIIWGGINPGWRIGMGR
jgi:hypothetical protein